MWIVTNKLIFSLYPEDIAEPVGTEIKINRSGTAEEFTLKFNTEETATAAWKKLQDAVKKGFQNVSIYTCEEVRREITGRKGRLF